MLSKKSKAMCIKSKHANTTIQFMGIYIYIYICVKKNIYMLRKYTDIMNSRQ